MKKCLYCGAEFEPYQERSKYCSLKRPKGGAKTCAWCGKEFFTENGHTKYCCPDCFKSAYKDKKQNEVKR